jgi:hypothetical protein
MAVENICRLACDSHGVVDYFASVLSIATNRELFCFNVSYTD